ncbi:unnamed protein product [Durusdinium trenchii]|uniref:C2 domain-containing protein n=2 Tax=Durusdinium trenchii TaxID=1381693 RepID=A0ABP0SY78_9DINO
MYPDYGDERVNLLQKIQTKDDFAAKKWRCLTHPSRAMETLAPWAVLEVGILTARDLTERDAGYFSTDIAPDSFVQVLMDDRPLEKCKTTVARAKSEPMWIYNCEVEIMAPMSMLRFQVKDNRPSEQDVDIGFFDICVGDIPYHQDIEGWFELRFQESLLSTSVDRYNNHCQVREETKTEEQFQEIQEEKVNNSTALMDIPDDDHETKLVQKKQRYSSSKERALDAFQACVQSTADKAEAYGFESLSKAMTEGKRKRRSNAGELYVSLRLKLLVSKADSMFAYALDPPLMVNYGGLKQEVTLSKQVDMQRCYDDFYEVKVHVLDNALLCCAYGFRYLVSWRSTLLSLIYLVGLLTCCWKTYLNWAIIPLLLALSLCINSFTEARQYMTRGGLNAPLTEEGFKQTAAWRDSGEVLKFIERLLREDMKAIVEDPKGQLKAFAAQCVRDGKPTLSLEEARLALLAADYVEDQKVYFRRGDLVWVDGRYPARVESSSGDLVKVSYEKTLIVEEKPPEEVRTRQLILRADALGLPSLPALGPVRNVILGIYPIIEDLRHASLPAIQALTKLLTWKSAATCVILIVLLVISALFTWAAVMHWLAGSHKGDMGYWQEVFIAVLRSLDNTVCALVVIGIFLLQASWLTAISSGIKMLTRSGHGRDAPAQWAFFREDPAQAEFLRSLQNPSEHRTGVVEEHPANGMFHLPYMTADTGSASATYQATHSSSMGPHSSSMGP